MVIVVMAPLIVRRVRKIPVGWLIGFGVTVLACAMGYYSSFNLALAGGDLLDNNPLNRNRIADVAARR
jgi:hypothetical protein